jgi:hypothetical protein
MAAIQIRALDTRVASKLTNREPADVIVTERITVADAVTAILRNLGVNQLSRLTLIMHGFGVLMEGNRAPDFRLSVPLPNQLNVSRPVANFCKIYGGYGLEFGRDQLSLGTVAPFARLKGKFTSGGLLVIFGCAAADSGPDLGTIKGERLSGNGPQLLRQLALLTGAPVRAADSLQQVTTNWMMGSADRGPWTGRTFLFMPDGRQIDESQIPMSVY